VTGAIMWWNRVLRPRLARGPIDGEPPKGTGSW